MRSLRYPTGGSQPGHHVTSLSHDLGADEARAGALERGRHAGRALPSGRGAGERPALRARGRPRRAGGRADRPDLAPMSSSRRGFLRDIVAAAARNLPAGEPGLERSPEPEQLLSDEEMVRYSRQLVLPEWSEVAQLALRDASVLVIGAGGLGPRVALHVAGGGVGRLGIVDADEVELPNLHRQHLHFTPDLGQAKVDSAAAKLRYLNPEVLVEPYRVRVDAENAAG